MRATMKVFILTLFFSALLFAQNPDGRKPSIHFTPFITNYSVTDLTTNTSVGNFDSSFNFTLMLKVPITNNITLSPFYATNTLKGAYSPYYPYPYYNVEVSTSNYGFTFSYYFD